MMSGAASDEDKSEWVAIVLGDDDAAAAPVEVQSEPDGTLLLTSITAQFPGTTGLKFLNESTGTYRGIRCRENVLFPPSKDGWGSAKFVCVRPQVEEKKRKLDDAGVGYGKSQKIDDGQTTDLIVLGLPFKTTEEQIKTYFAGLGETLMVELKRHTNGQSRGYAFLRFVDKAVQDKVLLTRHKIDDRWCDVKLPDSQQPQQQQQQQHSAPEMGRKEDQCKIFVANITEAIKKEDLLKHFGQFGEVTDVFYPETPHRGFAFVTFVEVVVAQSLIGQNQLINGLSVHIGPATPKSRRVGGGMSGGGGGGPVAGNNGGYGGYSGNPWTASGNSYQERSQAYHY